MNSRTIQWRKGGEKQFSAVIAGDFSPREENSDDVARRAEEITAEVKPFFHSADLRIVQWECAVTRSNTPIPKSGPNHRCYPECLAFARALETDVVLLANNHTGDYDRPGIEDTISSFQNAQIGMVGIGMDSAEAEKPLLLERNGCSVAILNAAEHEFGIAENGRPGGNGLNPIRLSQQIRELKAAGKIVIVSLHGGHEFYSLPSPRMKELFRFLADSGADAVFNCHTHCPLGYEVWHGVPIVYCPGNFYFPPRPTSLPCWYIGYLPKFSFDERGAFQLEILPYYNRKEAVQTMDDAETAAFFDYLQPLCELIADDVKMQAFFDAWCIRSGLNGYAGLLMGLKKPENWRDAEANPSWLSLRNLLTCESHKDLLRNSLLLLQYRQWEEAARLLPEIDAMQNPDWVKKTR